jgi:hypothetical protein
MKRKHRRTDDIKVESCKPSDEYAKTFLASTVDDVVERHPYLPPLPTILLLK